MTQEFGVNEIAQKIHLRLQRYLEAQYHIKNTSIIEERKSLLEEPGSISQRPYIEVTPSYATGTAFSELQIPNVIANLLNELSKFSPPIGVFPPYKHQSDALESFFSTENEKDLIVATGTGSGKTETFLYTILGLLALEAEERPHSFQKNGVRTLLLYPMNALVSDQTSRLRRLFGNENFAYLFRERWRRHPKFGMYTSRTPYPGLRSNSKDGRNLALLIKYYADLESSTENEKKVLVEELKKRGRFPAKNILSFFNETVAQQKTYQSGKKTGQTYTSHHWEDRFNTHPDDRELLTRHEIQISAPDLLVTNYSMLEYMMLRPIEASIFNQTKEWLQSDERNQFLLVLDEAHMYRGVGGAEVGFLIRRLMSRLGINRDRLRCILTSASLGDSEETQLKGIEFANGLTGKTLKRSVAVVRGTKEERKGAKKGTDFEADGLILVDEEKLASADINPQSAFENIKEVASKLDWSVPPNLNESNDNLLQIRKYVTEKLTGFGPLELLIEKCSGNATSFSELANELFPFLTGNKAEQATNGLLALGTFARRTEPNRDEQPLLPTRVHMLYRGLPAIYACINPNCGFRRDSSENNLLGRLYIEPRTHCRCGSRVYELYTHRDCGTAFLRVFGVEDKRDFFWHESGGKISSLGNPLHEFHILLEEPHPTYGEVIPIWIDIKTGRVKIDDAPDELDSTRLCYMASNPLETEDNLTTFKTCPVCLKRTSNQRGLKIMDLSTKGEQPFANLIREQFVCQIPTKPFNSSHPNAGRKSLLFSDGRQKAARLARDLPREVERDSFREALVLAIKKLNDIKKDATMDDNLYASFLAVCAEFNLHFFDKGDQEQLIEECLKFNKYYDGDFQWFLEESGVSPTMSFRKALLRQISDPYYSLVSACAAYVEPRKRQFETFRRGLGDIAAPEIIEQVTFSWIQKMLSKMAYDPAIPYNTRMQEFQYFDKVSSDSGLKQFFDNLRSELNLDQNTINQFKDGLFNFFTGNADGDSDSGKLLKPQSLQIRLTLKDIWWQCIVCGNLQLKNITGKCDNCRLNQLEEISPNHPYMTARKGFFREPLYAVLNGERPVHITAEEHTAQLSQRDSEKVYATTEEFELRFQDVPLDEKKPPVDILSCTTTMEVGIDIGSLTAVGLRTVPPQRENYQQRAGRAGRRGTSISSVITFAQGGAHDAYYFGNPGEMISGPPREPRIKIDNPRLAKRHINSYLLQTFFYEKLEGLSQREREDIIKNRPNLMSAYGDVQEFFKDSGLFTFHSFKQWIEKYVTTSRSLKMSEVINWLPDDLFGQESSETKKRNFIEGVIGELLKTLIELGEEYSSNTNQTSEQPRSDDNEDWLLLNVLFNRGLLPSYAFPTDLCSFYILKRDSGMITIKERPQLAKAQALSEYAPGRLLVVNKETYRVGGMLFYPITTSRPAEELFSKDLKKYIGCQNCTYLRLEENGNDSDNSLICPICDNDLYVRELMDPPDFAPEGSRPLSERDRDQDITYATSAELPEVSDREAFDWEECSGMNLQYTKKEDVKLIVVNKGKDFRGFDFCESCGAGWISETGIDSNGGSHQRPFPIPGFVYKKEAPSNKCNGEIRKNIFLEHQFLTDVFLLRIPIKSPIDFSPDKPWLRDSLTTLAEAFTLGASLQLDIDPGELGAGFRMLASTGNENGNLEIFLYDTTSGGAGYAYEAGENLIAVLERTKLLLSKCTNDECETSCTKCLRHYGNRFLHTRLNRKLGLQLLDYAMNGAVPEIEAINNQRQILDPLARFLQLEGWETLLNAGETPLSAISKTGRRINVGVYPALIEESAARDKHKLMRTARENIYLLPDYMVQNDLPTAYQTIINTKPSVSGITGKKKVLTNEQMSSIPVIKLSEFLSGIRNSDIYRNVPTPENAGAVAGIEVDLSSLSVVDVYLGDLLVLKEFKSEIIDSDDKFLIQSQNDTFKATKEKFTVGNLKALTIAEDKLIQISYSKPESAFRPERLKVNDIKILGLVVKVIPNEN
jgi:ATP-dependent helicase YprA (DUF1998 family)